MKTTIFKQLLPAIAAVAFCGAQAQAAFVFDYSGATVNQTGSYLLGNNFTVNSTISVNQLGVFSEDLPSDATIPIAIYEHTGSAANSGWVQITTTSATIGAGANVDGASKVKYVSITPVILGPGLYSVVTATATDYNSQANYPNASSVTFNDLGGALALGGYDIWSGYTPNTPLAATLDGLGTTGPNDPNYPWAVPVFGAGTFSATAVPESTTIIGGLLLLLPFTAGIIRSLRKAAL